MTNLRDAADAAKLLNKSLRGVLLVGQALEELGDLEQAKTEAVRVAEAARAERDKMLDECKQVQIDLSAVATQRDAVKAEAEQIRSIADANSKAILAEAKRKARVIEGNAADEATRLHNSVAEQADAHAMALKQWAAEEAEAKARVDALKAEFAALKERIGA